MKLTPAEALARGYENCSRDENQIHSIHTIQECFWRALEDRRDTRYENEIRGYYEGYYLAPGIHLDFGYKAPKWDETARAMTLLEKCRELLPQISGLASEIKDDLKDEFGVADVVDNACRIQILVTELENVL